MRLPSALLPFVLGAFALGASAQTSGPDFSKAYGPDTIGPGSVTTLTFTIDNTASNAAVGELSFTDTLPAGVTVASPAVAGTTCSGSGGRGDAAVVSAVPGGDEISFSGGAVPANSSCAVSVNVTSSTPGTTTNTSSPLSSNEGLGGTASADLTVDAELPGFTKSFSPASLAIGGRSTLTFTIDNSLSSSTVNRLVFSDDFPAGMTVASPSNLSTTCPSPAGTPTLTASGGRVEAQFVGADFGGFEVLAPGGSCTVSVDVDATAVGALGNVSSPLDVTIGTTPRVAGRASAVLTSLADRLTLTKSFLFDPVPPGGTVPLRFELRNVSRAGAASGITFEDPLGAVLPGLASTTSFPFAACGGTVDSADSGATLVLTGGSLLSGELCAFEVDVLVPPGTATGAYLNTTTPPTGLVGSDPVGGFAAEATLFVEPVPLLTKTFAPNPVAPGGDVTVSYSVTNTSVDFGATSVAFVDPLFDLFPTLGDATLPTGDPCGVGSSVALVSDGVSGLQVSLTGGDLPIGGTCSFDVEIPVPAGFGGGDYPSTTDVVTAEVGGQTLTGAPATDVLSLVPGPAFSKAFGAAAVAPGGEVDLTFTLVAPAEVSVPISDIAFTDDLNAALSGLAASPGALPVSACGGTLTSSDGGSTLEFSNGALVPGETCEITVPVTVPSGAVSGTYLNTTTPVTATAGGLATTGATASADLVVTEIAFSKSFTDDPVAPGGSVTLQYTIVNESTTATLSSISFSDDYDDAIPGLAVGTAPGPEPCGVGSSASILGTTLFLTSGALGPGASCTFDVTLDVPPGTAIATYPSTTSALSASADGTSVTAPPALDALVVDVVLPPAPLTLAAAFDPAVVLLGATSTLTLTIDNAASGAAATGLAVTATLPAGAVIAGPADAATTCGAGTATAAAGGSTLELAGGEVAAGAACTVSVTVVGDALGMVIATTTDLTSSAGATEGTSAKLTVTQDLAVTKTDAIGGDDPPEAAGPGDVITYTITIDGGTERTRDFTLSDTPDPNTTPVPGSATFDPAPTADVATADIVDGEVVATLEGLLGTATLTFDVTVNEVYSRGVEEACNQATVSSGAGGLLSDDPETEGLSDATCTPLAPFNRPPVAVAAADEPTAECSAGAAAFVLDGSGSSDPDEDALTYVWTGPFPEGGGSVTGIDPTVTLPLGESTVTLTVTDAFGASDSADLVLTVEDTTAPVIALDGQPLVEVARFSGPYLDPGATATDLCDGDVAVTVSGSVDTNVLGDYVLTYAAVDAAENPAEATRTVSVIDDPAAIASPFLFLVEDQLKVDSQIRTEGDIHSNDKLEFKNGIRERDGGPSLHVGGLTASDDLKVHKDQVIDGDVRAPDIDLKNGSVVTGAVVEAPVALIPLPIVDVDASGPDVDVEEDGVRTLAPGSYGKLDVEEGGLLRLTTGTYTFEEIKLDDGAGIEATLTTGPVIVNVEKKVDFKDDVTVAVLPNGEADARYLTFRVAGNKVDLGKRSVVAAQIIAPEAKVTIDKETRFVGAIVAEDVDVKDEAIALYVTVIGPPALAVAEGGGETASPETPTGTLDGDDETAPVATPAAPETRAVPEVFALGAAYPNPTDGTARVRFDVPAPAAVRLAVYDVLGREVAVLAAGAVEAGSHEAVFYAHRLPAGTYLVRFTAEGGFAETRPLTVLR